jgi:hypothetical protein
VILPHLNLIEDPILASHPIIVEAVVASTSVSYLAPAEVEAVCEDEDGFERIIRMPIKPDNPINLQLVGVNEAVKYRRLKRFLGLSGEKNIDEKRFRTVYRVRVRPPVFTLEKRGEKIIDEHGFEYKSFDVYIVSEKPIVFHPSSLIRMEGMPVPNPRNQQTTLLIYRVEFPEEAENFSIDKLMVLKQKFEGKTVEERLKWILDNFELYSKIVGRRNLAAAALLIFFTPLQINFNGEVQRGWGNGALYGDTTTGKSETLRKMIMLLKQGILITAETASTVGLTGTATQIERGEWFVDWGFLVLQDRKLLAVDGAHKLSLSNWAALAEAERSGVVNIAKAAKNTAYARTRQIKIANPVDREADKYTTKKIGDFLYPVQALSTVFDKTSIARLDLAVSADSRDVQPEEINKLIDREPEAELFLLSEALKWCWSGVVEVRFTEEAAEAIHKYATELYKTFYYDEIPLCSIDMKWKLGRLSAALAFLTLSTEDFKTVTVTEDHVNVIVKFLTEEYSKVGLNILAQTERHEALTLEDVQTLLTKITAQLENTMDAETICDVLRYFALHGRATRDELMAKFNLAENKQLRPLLATLTSEGLIKARKGFYPEPKLIQAYKTSEGFNFIKVIKVIKVGEEPPKNLEEKIESTPSFSDLDKVDNLDKKNLGSIAPTAETCVKWRTKDCPAAVPSAIFPDAKCPQTCPAYELKKEG